ncbi:hypothetical protein [Lysinibacillus sp. G01H]|uniref:hypothetical protein n=1 Tax=Lysinibacillus sp. G01H TaxID=3026425 RepID=UPI00237D4B4D|nr:hypothetical protein [Lysinibacillus sp. G01H]WDU80005.1 hypothetical protein PSR12_02355 [Lysinibacillus sp. G01H]
MDAEKNKQRFRELSEKHHQKMDEVLAYGKAHSPEEQNGQEFKTKMEQYSQELNEIMREKMLIWYRILYPERGNQLERKF